MTGLMFGSEQEEPKWKEKKNEFKMNRRTGCVIILTSECLIKLKSLKGVDQDAGVLFILCSCPGVVG